MKNMAYKKKSKTTKKKYSAAEKKAYNIGVGVAVARSSYSSYAPNELLSQFSSSSSKKAYYKGFERGAKKTFNLSGYSMK